MQRLHGMKGDEFTTGDLIDVPKGTDNNCYQESAEVIVANRNEPRKKKNVEDSQESEGRNLKR